MKKIKNKTVSFIVIALVMLIIVVFILFILRTKADKNRVVYQTAIIEKGSMENSVTATGTVEPITQVEVGTQVSGIIDKIYVDYNSIVKQGQVLAELDKTVLEQELNSVKSELNSCKSESEFQNKNFERISGLFGKNMVSQSDYDEALYNFQRAENSYKKAQASYKKAQTNLGYATIYSPINGVVLSRAVDVGQTVAASFSTPTLFSIANDLTRMQVVADVDEADIGQVEEGMPVSFYVDAFPDDVFYGTVMQVRLEPTTTNNVVTYEVVVDAPNPQEKLKPGLTANISIYSLRKSDIALLPIKATLFDLNEKELPQAVQNKDNKKNKDNKESMLNNEGLHNNDTSATFFVWIKTNDGKNEKRRVIVGANDGIYYEIISGVKEGEEVLVSISNNGQAARAEAAKAESATSPFMPKRPGSNKK